MGQSLADRIRGMAQYLDDPQVIANTLGLEISVVEGVLSGEIPNESLEDYDLAKPVEIKVVEQKRFIRSRAIGVVATNNFEGSLLTAYLAANLADQVSYDVAIADFNEYPVQSTLLSIIELLPLSLRLEVGDSYELRSIERIFSRLSPSFQRLIAMLHCEDLSLR